MLQDTAKLTGSFEIVLARDPTVRKTVTLDHNSLLFHYNLMAGYPTYANFPNIDARGILTVNTRDSVSFFYPWDFIADDTTNLAESVFEFAPDPQFPTHLISKPEKFILSGYVQVFTRVGLVIIDPVSCVVIYDIGP